MDCFASLAMTEFSATASRLSKPKNIHAHQSPATYFHADAADLAAKDITRVPAAADARIFHKSYGDQNGELWSPSGACSPPRRKSRISRREDVGWAKAHLRRAHHLSRIVVLNGGHASLCPSYGF
jgi:hypothetical protein